MCDMMILKRTHHTSTSSLRMSCNTSDETSSGYQRFPKDKKQWTFSNTQWYFVNMTTILHPFLNSHPFAYNFAAHLSKSWSLFPFPLNVAGQYDLYWAIKFGRTVCQFWDQVLRSLFMLPLTSWDPASALWTRAGKHAVDERPPPPE